MKKIFILLFACFLSFGSAQQTKTLHLKKYRTAILPDSLRETSGLSFFKDQLYTFNDSGNTSELFQIDKSSGKILRTLKTNLQNKDWEALANDGRNFYVGDLGNNAGTRKDLIIYKIPFTNGDLKKDSITAYPFYYPEQSDYTFRNINNDYDAESLIYLNNQLHIFTKEWASKNVTHYVIDLDITQPQAAKKLESFPLGYVATDAYYYDNKLYLIGYTKTAKVYLSVFQEQKAGMFFSSTPQKYYLGSSFKIGQIEGIAVNDYGIYVSGERFNNPLGSTKPYLYFIDFKKAKIKNSNSPRLR